MNSRIFAVAGKVGTDYSGMSGYAVIHDGTDIVVVTSATSLPHGFIADVNTVSNELSVALPGAVIPVKVTGAVKCFQRGVLVADGSVKAETGAATEVACCQFLSDGADAETVNALVLAPVKRA